MTGIETSRIMKICERLSDPGKGPVMTRGFPSSINTHESAIVLTNTAILLPCTPHTHSVGPSSPNFHLILSNVLKAYGKQTKHDLLVHPMPSIRSPASGLPISSLLHSRRTSTASEITQSISSRR